MYNLLHENGEENTRLGAAESTIKIHRGRVMEKMGAASAADLVKMAERLAQPSLESLSP